ncbi:3-methyladenine DNA glycosylase/8-oxoguanine DNA glycosylase (AlkA) (PDB:1DIZ) [Commensalibacter communis]|uniref:DNA-3-methyladenine glycosylase II n=1 Tax=Commensalibacter communis TaxID=2972786 RepID=A0A9W4X5W7_9PROT|nr:DNA-3-methyladenine glycosylase 2 family protein [Commensalibacter communis]CAI3923968.1 3-methyladenine DNA glycosylase/8-oxoguanine DNA glycosylase (AlkA) (PDB:1DIZ) [Commensalibacter communis]CAI3924017.1 3-methyladenine DNA glycosylase/8-oxoguanine DNA glycosylase (AlkA) (PDB:1DIZ) [Commensalibacter communis]CAI3929351.1 3-methyladenine DNA glycosylase/8-oxoguanine DNA glycosylase (AlkA) (PDB:1DIZ) [Commensalibacter communis]CAI3930678.1 3-methyladenine DNA glycosylase/8-oxoguanine DNA g
MLAEKWQKKMQEATDFLSLVDKDLALVIQKEKNCRLQIKEKQEPYFALLEAIAGQQLHAKAVTAILNRLKLFNNGHFPNPKQLLAYSDTELRACGFSFRKVASLKQLAVATIEGRVPSYYHAQTMSDQALIDLLTQLPGVGIWTVEMVLIFTLGRLDIMPVHDFGIREGWKICKQLSEQPKPKELKEKTASWSPYRSVGAWFLWRAVDQKKPKEKQNPLTL